ncbi:hypothetical protein TNCV_3050551 [Trichonephila clavipes]|nr:hypothetical protein TNCV_3050551 [Trichonephila clavipes]
MAPGRPANEWKYIHVAEGCQGSTARLLLCRGSTLGFVAEDDLIPIHCNSTSSCMTHSKVVSLAAHVMGTAIIDVLVAGSLAMVSRNTGSVVKVFPVSGQRTLRMRCR